jgi:hypothetical protein
VSKLSTLQIGNRRQSGHRTRKRLRWRALFQKAFRMNHAARKCCEQRGRWITRSLGLSHVT